VNDLLKTGKHTITAITRASGSNAQLPAGVTAAPVDYDDEAALISALTGQQFLIISLPGTAAGIQDKIVAAAGKAGVPWIMPNGYGVDFINDSLAEQTLVGPHVRAGVKAVEQTGVSSWIMMCCSFWYEFSLTYNTTSYGFDVANKKVTFFDDGKTKIDTSTHLQCGRAMASLLSLKELPDDENDDSPTLSTWRNKPLYVSSFLASQRDMLDSLHRVMGTTDADWTIDYEKSSERWQRGMDLLASGDRSGFSTAMYSRVFYPNGDGNIRDKYGLANEALGLPEEDLDEATARAVEIVKTDSHPYKGR
jgi:hypothetical protein